MSTIRPFRGIRPAGDLAASIAALPYDVYSSSEAMAENKVCRAILGDLCVIVSFFIPHRRNVEPSGAVLLYLGIILAVCGHC